MGHPADFLERERMLLMDMHAIYKVHDAAIAELRDATVKCEAALKRLEKRQGTKGLEPAVLRLEDAVANARKNSVDEDTIGEVQITLTNARANLRTLKAAKLSA